MVKKDRVCRYAHFSLAKGQAKEARVERKKDRGSGRAIVRRYAKQVLAAARVSDVRLDQAFASVRRENFLGPGPWPILRWLRLYVPTPDADPVYLYTDGPVGIVPERRTNNGQP